MRVLVLHGPNLAALGTREPEVYGTTSLAELDGLLVGVGRELGLDVTCEQSDLEGVLVERIRSAVDVLGIILNPAGFTHSSVAIRDAVAAAAAPVIEVHLSNLHAREPFRRRSLIAGACRGQISGLGVDGYVAALHVLARWKRGEAQ